ncbi:MAG: hypothetical protein J6E42_03010, partial [Firmicutes bacterium]|nr:hypothetical protein [Bacillota bacterium]
LLIIALMVPPSFTVFANSSNLATFSNDLKILEKNGYTLVDNSARNIVIMKNDEDELVRISINCISEKVNEYTFEESGLRSVVLIDDDAEEVYINGERLVLENEVRMNSEGDISPFADPIMNWYRTVNPMLGSSSDYGNQTLAMSGNYALAQAIKSIAKSAFISAVGAAIKYAWSGPGGLTVATALTFYGVADAALGTYYNYVDGVEKKVYYRQYKQAYINNSSTSQAFRHHFKFYDKNGIYVSESSPIYESWSTTF